MKAQRINSGFKEKYPYQYYIDLRAESPEKAAAILKWVKSPEATYAGSEFQGTVAGLGLYLQSEKELTAFLLKWS